MFFFFFVFYFFCLNAACGILIPQQGSNLLPLHWKRGVAITGLPGKSSTQCLQMAHISGSSKLFHLAPAPNLNCQRESSNSKEKEKRKRKKGRRREEVREKVISSFNILFFSMETSGGSSRTICMFCIMSVSLWEFHKLMMITQHISFKSLDIQSLLLYRVCLGQRWNETGEILCCPFCQFHHRICTCYAACIQKQKIHIAKDAGGQRWETQDTGWPGKTEQGQLVDCFGRKGLDYMSVLGSSPGFLYPLPATRNFFNYAKFISLQTYKKIYAICK